MTPYAEATGEAAGIARELVCLVVPCYNEQQSVELFYRELARVMDGIADGCPEWRVIFVDDGSEDQTLARMRDLHASDERVCYLSFTRNFGKESALVAGMRKAALLDAAYVVVMDVDLQDPPELIPEMLRVLRESDCDVVATYRMDREGEPPVRSWFAHRFYALMNRLSEVEMRDGARDFRMMRRRVVDSVISMPENQRFSKGLFAWGGFKTEWIGYQNKERAAGSTSWSFLALVVYALDGMLAFSVTPLIAISLLGLAFFVLALILLIFIFVRALLFGDPVAGWPSLVCFIALFSSIQMLCVGVLGLYLSKLYSEVKRRPLYLIAEES